MTLSDADFLGILTDQMPFFAADDLGVHCLLNPVCSDIYCTYGRWVIGKKLDISSEEKKKKKQQQKEAVLIFVFIIRVVSFSQSSLTFIWNITGHKVFLSNPLNLNGKYIIIVSYTAAS